MQSLAMDVEGSYGFPSLADFDTIKMLFADYSATPQYSALERYYQSANAASQFAEKQLPVSLFQESLEWLIGQGKSPANPAVVQIHARLKDYQAKLTRTLTILSGEAKTVPKVMHFVWVGGSEVGNIQRDYMNIWRSVLAKEEYRFNLWYDSDALLAFEMNRVILDSARVHAMESGGDKITKPSQLAQMIEDRARVLKQQMSLYINQPQWAGRQDEARIQLMVSAYGKDRLVLEAFRKKCLASHEAVVGQDLRLRDVRQNFPDHFLSDVYQRELSMRGNFAAASDVVRLQASDLEGGRYSDMDYLPPFADKLAGVDISTFSQMAKLGVLQLLLNEDDTLMPGRDRQRYADRTEHIPSEHKEKLLAFAREKPGVSKIFVAPADHQVPQGAMRFGTGYGLISSGEMNAHFIAHPRSAMNMAYMQMIRTNYDCMFEVERRLLAAKITAPDDNRILAIVQNVVNEAQAEGKFPPSDPRSKIISAIVNYYQDGIRVGARGTIELTGPGAAVAGLTNYMERNFFPDQVNDVRAQLKLTTGYNVYTEEEMISSWTVNDDADEWLAREQEKWKSAKLKSRYTGDLPDLLKGQRLTFKQGWPVIEGKLVFLTEVLQQLMNDLGEPFANALRDKLSGDIIFDKRIDLGFDQRKNIQGQPDSAIPVSIGEQSAGNLNELFTLLAHESVSLDQLSPLQRTVLGGLFDAQRLDAEGFSETWRKMLEVARETADGGFFHRYNVIEKILKEHKSPAFEAGLAQGGRPGSETAGELKVRALAEPMSLYEWGQRIAQINSTARRDYQAQILKHAAQVRERFFREGAISARQIPQDLLRQTSGDPGRRCYPLALLTAAALDLGSEAERALIGRIANASRLPNDAESRAMFAALDDLAGIAASEVGRSKGVLNLKTLLQNLEAKTSAVYLLDTGKHALLVAKVLVDAKPVYRFFDPNFAIFGFSQIDTLQKGIERHLAGDGEMARLYGLAGSNDAMFTVIELDTQAIAAKMLPSKLLVTDLLKSETVAGGRTVSVWDAQASALVRSLSENVRMGEGLAQLDARYWADEFEDATSRLRSDNKLGGEYLPLLETVQETAQKNYTLTMVDARNPEIAVKVITADSRFAKVGAHIKRLAKKLAGPNHGPAEADGGSRLSFAFAIQAIITEMRSREYQSKTGQIPALSIALQVQAYVSYAQLGFGVVGDSVQIVSLVRQVAASEKALASGASMAGRLLGRTTSAVGFGFSAINIGFDIYGLTVATNEEQRARLYTQLAFNVAGLGLDIAALAIGGAVGGALAAIAVPVMGVGIGAAAIASNLGQINDKARAVGRHLFLINEAYTAAGHKIEDGVLTFAPEAVITQLDLRRRSVVFDSQKLCRTMFQTVGLPSFENSPQELQRAINIREALSHAASLTIDSHKPISALVLPCTPVCYYGYEYQLGSAGFAPDDDLLARLKAYQRRLDYGDYPLPVAQDSESLSTSFPNILDSWKEQLEFDEHGEQRLQLFSTAPFPHILYKLLAFNKPTLIRVSLNEDCRQLVVPRLPPDWKQLLSYEITAHSGQVQLTLTPGIVSVVLHQPPLVDGPVRPLEPSAKADWAIAAPWASEEQVRFEGPVLFVDGIRIEGFEGYLQLRNGELFHWDQSAKRWLLVSVSLSEVQEDSHSAVLLTRLRSLRRENRLASGRITLHNLLMPLTDSSDRVFITAYYDVSLDRLLYARNLPADVIQGVVLGAVAGQYAWFYHPDHPAIWRVDSITGTVNHLYRLMSPERGARITRFEGTADGGLRVVQETKPIGETEYSLEYVIYGQTLTFTRISANNTSQELSERTLKFWQLPLNRFTQPQPLAAGTAAMAISSSIWKAAPFVGLRCLDHGEFAYSGWLRLHDSRYILNDFGVTQRTLLMWDQTDDRDVIIHDAETRALIRVPLDRVEVPDIFGEVFESNVAELIPAAGRYIAVKDDGRMFEIDTGGELRFLGVGKRWFDLNRDWLDALSGLAQKNAVEPFVVMGLPSTSGTFSPAAWCVAGQLVIADVGDGRALGLLARTPDGLASWLFDAAAGKLYRQALLPFEAVRAALGTATGLLNLQSLPKALPVWAQWQFSEVEPHAQGLLACTREGLTLELLDNQPAKVVGTNSQWSFVDEQTEDQLRDRLQAVVSGLAHAAVMSVGARDGCHRYYVPQSDQLFEVYGPTDGQWPVFLGTRNGSLPLLFDATERCIFSSAYKPEPSISVFMQDCLARRDKDVMCIESPGIFADFDRVIPEGVDKLLLTFGSPQQICHVTDVDWQRVECIVLECRQRETDQASNLPILYLDLSVIERLLVSVKDGQLVFSDPDNAHSLIVRNADGVVMPMLLRVTAGGRDHQLHIEQLLNKVMVDQVDTGYVQMKALITMSDTSTH